MKWKVAGAASAGDDAEETGVSEDQRGAQLQGEDFVKCMATFISKMNAAMGPRFATDVLVILRDSRFDMILFRAQVTSLEECDRIAQEQKDTAHEQLKRLSW